MRAKLFILGFLVAVLFSASLSYPQVPQMINYQAKVTDEGGNPLHGDYDMTFSIYDDSIAGTQLWTETQLQVPIENGIFSVLLGSVDTISFDVFNGEIRYLEVQVGSDLMTPRKPMVSVPYAFTTATSSGRCWQCPAYAPYDDRTYLVEEDDRVGIGTTEPHAALNVYGDPRYSKMDLTQKVEYAGLLMTTKFYSGYFTPGVFWSTKSYPTKPMAGIYLKETTDGTFMYLGTSTNYWQGITNDAMVIDYEGHVGIGTTDPQTMLDVACPDDPESYMRFDTPSDGDGVYLTLHEHRDHNLLGLSAYDNNWGNYLATQDPRAGEGQGFYICGGANVKSFPIFAVNADRTYFGYNIDGKGHIRGGDPGDPGDVYVHGSVGIGTTSSDFDLTFGEDNPREIGIEQASDALENGYDLRIHAGDGNASDYASGGDLYLYGGLAYDPVTTPVHGDVILAHTGSEPRGNVGIRTTEPEASLNIYEERASTLQSDFTETVDRAGLLITTDLQYDDTYSPGVFWSTQNDNSTKPKAGIYLKQYRDGTSMYLATSNDYLHGITNNAMVIDYEGDVGIGTEYPDFDLTFKEDSEREIGIEQASDDGENGYDLKIHAGRSKGAGWGGNLYLYGGANDLGMTTSGDVILAHDGGSRTGKVGIRIENPTRGLDVNGIVRIRHWGASTESNYDVWANEYGDLFITNGTSAGKSSLSSKKYKQNIRKLQIDPEQVVQLKAVRFEWKTTGKEDIGLIAEDVDEVIPDLVVYDKEGRPDGVKYDKVAVYLLELLKAQQERISALENRIAELQRNLGQ